MEDKPPHLVLGNSRARFSAYQLWNHSLTAVPWAAAVNMILGSLGSPQPGRTEILRHRVSYVSVVWVQTSPDCLLRRITCSCLIKNTFQWKYCSIHQHCAWGTHTWSTHTTESMEYYSVVKSNAVLVHDEPWKHAQWKSQTQKATDHVSPPLCNI